MKRFSYPITALGIALLLLNPLSVVMADNDDHLEARRLSDSGEILPLEVIIKTVRQTHPGKIIGVELDKEDDRVVYEMEVLGENGVVEEIYVDAKTGKLLSADGKD